MKRRQLLKGLGAVVVVVSGGAVWRAHQQGVVAAGSGPAYEPWDNWRTEEAAGPLALVRAGILASNPHNTQPWLFHVTGDRIELYADRARNLGAFDPFLREMHLGLGCALENMLLTAAATGFKASLSLSSGSLENARDDAAPSLVATIDLTHANPAPSELHQAIPHRHTNRGPYDPARAISSQDQASLRHLAASDPAVVVHLITAEDQKKTFRNVVLQATEAIVGDPTMVADSDAWFRHSWADVQELRDGVTLDATGLGTAVVTMAKMLPTPSPDSNHEHWLGATKDVHLATAPAFGFVTVADLYDRQQTLRAGQAWQRLHLWATANGLAMQPLNQPVEWIDRQRGLGREPAMASTLGKLIGHGSQPTFAFRLGYAMREAQPSPRRSVEQVLL
jgi:hypothetical protein